MLCNFKMNDFHLALALTAKGELLATLQKALDRGILVVASTQCVKGQVDLHAYALGAHGGGVSARSQQCHT